MIIIGVLSSSGFFLKLRGILNVYIDHLSIKVVVVMSYYSSKYYSVYKTKNTKCVF